MDKSDIISLISNIREKANKYIVNGMEQKGVKGLATSHGDIIFQLLNHQVLTMKELAERIGKDKSTVTVLVNKLIDKGYVQKIRDSEDNRVILVSLTEEGRNLKEMFNAISRDLIATVYMDISDKEAEKLFELLVKIKNNLQK